MTCPTVRHRRRPSVALPTNMLELWNSLAAAIATASWKKLNAGASSTKATKRYVSGSRHGSRN